MAIGRRDPLGLAKRPTGRHRKARVEPTPRAPPWMLMVTTSAKRAKEVIPGSGTERLAQVVEQTRRPTDRTEGLARGVDADTTIEEIGKGSESSKRSCGRGPWMKSTKLLHETHRRRQLEGSARESSTLGGRGVQIRRTVASAFPEWDSTPGEKSSARRPFNQSWQCRLDARSVRRA